MLQFSLAPEEYFTIGGSIVVQLADVAGGRAYLRVEADRSVPILRDKVLERQGAPRPACLSTPGRKRAKRRPAYLWNRDQEEAVQTMEAALERLEREGQEEAAALLRTQLKRLIPTGWEEEAGAG